MTCCSLYVTKSTAPATEVQVFLTEVTPQLFSRLGTYFFWTGNVRLVAALALSLSLSPYAILKQGEKEEHMCIRQTPAKMAVNVY